MDESPSLGELSPTGSVVHISPRSPVSSATTSQKFDSSPISPAVTPGPLRVVKPRSSRDSALGPQATRSTPSNRRLNSGRSNTIIPESIPKRRSSVAGRGKRKRKCIGVSPQGPGKPTTKDTSRTPLSSSPVETVKDLIVQKQRDMDIRSRIYQDDDSEAAKDHVSAEASLLATNKPRKSLGDDKRKGETDGKEISLSTKPPGQARLQKRIPDRAVTIAAGVMPFNPELLRSPTSITSSHDDRRTATAHGPPPWRVRPRPIEDPSSKGTPSTSSTSTEDGDPSQKLPRAKKADFLRKLDLMGKSKSMIAIHNSATETSLFQRVSQRISGEDRHPSGCSHGPTGTRSRSTTTSSTQTDTSTSGIADTNITRISRDESDPRASRLPKDHHRKADVVLPRKPCILAAKVDMIPELERLEEDTEKSMWVVMDVTADLFRPQEHQAKFIPEITALDVVVCFDLSWVSLSLQN